MARPRSLLSSILLLFLSAVTVTAFATENSFAGSPLRRSPSIASARHPLPSLKNNYPTLVVTSSSPLCLRQNSDEDANASSFSGDQTTYTPFDRPLLAVIDTFSLIIFAAIGKSSHSDTGSLDPTAVLVTAFPFVAAWLATSPLTGVYSPDDRENGVFVSTSLKVGKGWILAVPLGIAARGVLKGYVPPIPFMIVTLISTLVILAGARILFSFLEDFFVELVN